MDTSRRRRVEDLFLTVLELPEAERSSRLDVLCGDDPELRAEVEALLRAHERTDGLLDGEPPGLGEGIPLGAGGAPAQIGSYRILEEIGRGGMGIVYLAERADGEFTRRVALKVIRAEGDAHLRARVLAERQILASLDHESIVRLLDAGTAEGGRVYLVMEYVAGLPLDLYCDRMRLSVRERVRLFLAVARGVEHAHHNLVVHRDLKPSNILVTAEGRVKILDFGIAKLLNPGLAGLDAPLTRKEHRVLTPGYASPEQLRGEPLTTASDVYSLGVLLYRLLTGHPPHDPDEGTVSAVLSAMLEGDPERPSVQATRARRETLPDGSVGERSPVELASERRTTSQRLPALLSGDLDAIVMKALRKEPLRRYGSAEALAQDLDRYLAGEPVSAHKDSRRYRLGKLVRRRKAEAAAVLVALVALLAGSVATAWQARVAGRERDRAAEALRRSEVALAESDAVAGFLIELFRAGDPLVGGDLTARDLVRRGVDRIDELDGQPRVQARLMEALGELQRHMGAPAEARAILERAAALRRAGAGEEDRGLSRTLLELARAERELGEVGAARRHVEEALALRRETRPADDPDVAEAIYELGWLAEGEEQERLYREALATYAAGDSPVASGAILQALATNLRRQGRLEEALVTAQRSLAVLEGAVGPDAPETAVALFHVGDHLRDVRGALDRAEGSYRRGLAILEAEFGEHSLRLIHGLHSLATARSRRGDHAGAEAILRRALEIRATAVGSESPVVLGSLEALAVEIARQGRLDEAEALARAGMAIRERTRGLDRADGFRSFAVLGEVHAVGRRWDAAGAAFEQAFALRERAGGPDDIVLAELRRRWGRHLVSGGRYEAAEPPLLAALAGLEASYAEDHPNRVDARRALHELYTAWGRPDEADRYRVPPGVFYPY